ncbi:MAG: hypothetical protein EOM54_05465 [Clostridia bacterium]|nr:hypothetical protein [Clostridia bacterium]
MYNRYQGNTGRFIRVSDPEPFQRRSLPGGGRISVPIRQERDGKRPPPSRWGGLGGLLPLDGIQEKIGGLLSQVLSDGLETEDLILMLILYLMYKESGDTELLIILGAMFLL